MKVLYLAGMQGAIQPNQRNPDKAKKKRSEQ
jgi:hypothetical protein